MVDRSLDVLRRLDAHVSAPRHKDRRLDRETIAALVARPISSSARCLSPPPREAITGRMLKTMKRGSVIVDGSGDRRHAPDLARHPFASDTTWSTASSHYCVANMPGGVAPHLDLRAVRTPRSFALALADKGWPRFLEDPHLANGEPTTAASRVKYPAVAEALGYDLLPLDRALRQGDRSPTKKTRVSRRRIFMSAASLPPVTNFGTASTASSRRRRRDRRSPAQSSRRGRNCDRRMKPVPTISWIASPQKADEGGDEETGMAETVSASG